MAYAQFRFSNEGRLTVARAEYPRYLGSVMSRLVALMIRTPNAGRARPSRLDARLTACWELLERYRLRPGVRSPQRELLSGPGPRDVGDLMDMVGHPTPADNWEVIPGGIVSEWIPLAPGLLNNRCPACTAEADAQILRYVNGRRSWSSFLPSQGQGPCIAPWWPMWEVPLGRK